MDTNPDLEGGGMEGEGYFGGSKVFCFIMNLLHKFPSLGSRIA